MNPGILVQWSEAKNHYKYLVAHVSDWHENPSIGGKKVPSKSPTIWNNKIQTTVIGSTKPGKFYCDELCHDSA